MHDTEVSIVFDLAAPAAKRAEKVRQQLLEMLEKDPNQYAFKLGGVHIHPAGGTLVRIESRRYDWPKESWRVFDGLHTVFVRIKTEGTDHFPPAGFYHASTMPGKGISGATATVTWRIREKYALSEDIIDAVVRRVTDESYGTNIIRLEVPLAIHREWTLTLTAPSLPRAQKAYQLLRSGEWTPKMFFDDVTLDFQKVRLLTQAIEREEN